MYGHIPNVYTTIDVLVWSYTPRTYSLLGQIHHISWDTHVGVATSKCRKEFSYMLCPISKNGNLEHVNTTLSVFFWKLGVKDCLLLGIRQSNCPSFPVINNAWTISEQKWNWLNYCVVVLISETYCSHLLGSPVPEHAKLWRRVSSLKAHLVLLGSLKF